MATFLVMKCDLLMPRDGLAVLNAIVCPRISHVFRKATLARR